ncbi:hypothetical protein GCM10011376_18910 [Nocardioides flavus (ex Wang et al. 2016)]|uniref:Peptidase MA superfamily protein n=1 Tax=Nocardioides flavus (ex Wang et al. 2016) TaxID=2058780 RepID=A0ABQ3HKQ0_9ACTN|nr:hypothetical protein [Nocardioides flavus (ex Wang et al. 2016)]GHE17281.1 hypothetical protein GCM10011376_18910 [Nocardioides flavus (ex Wang et al. 2016)]
MSARSVLADQQTSEAGRPFLWAAGLSLFVALAVVVLVVRDGPTRVEPARPVEALRASPAQAAAALSSFVAAVEARDGEALVDLAPPASTEVQDQLSGVAANAASLDLRDVTARYVDQAGTVADDGSWAGVVEMTWRFDGFDPAPAQADVIVRFAPDGDGLAIAGFGAPESSEGRVPLWLRGELAVARSDDYLVLVDGDHQEADDVASRVRRGIPVVTKVLPDWSGPVVVEVPGSASDLDETLGVPSGTYAGIAAVTAGVGTDSGPDAPVHVFVNPEVTDGLRRAGAQVVMSHELVHIATDAARKPVEPWLLEGFADYVALRDTRLPDRVTLGRAIEAARREGVPKALPSAADFDTQGPDLQARYEEAWLACRIIAERLGERVLLDLYDEVAGGAMLEDVLPRLGMPTAVLTRAWRSRLSLTS